MNVYELSSVGGDNPLFEGMALANDKDDGLLEVWPSDWRVNYKTWVPKSLKASWPTPKVVGNVRRFNDFPSFHMSSLAFSQRAVDMLRDILEPNGELLPLRHKIGTYYFYNCTRMTNCVDLSKSKITKLDDGGIVSSTEKLVFIDEMLNDLTIFKIRTQMIEVFCTQPFVDRVEAVGLQGFMFIPIWPLPKGVTFNDERHRVTKAARKWKPREMPALEIKGNTVVLRLYCEKKKPSKDELKALGQIMSQLDKYLYNENQAGAESYFGNVEGHDLLDFEVRIFISGPDCDRLVKHLIPCFRAMPWPGKYHVVKRRGEVDATAKEEYVALH